MNTLKDMMDSLYCSTINNIDFNVSNKEIKFNLTLEEDGNKTNHTMKFVNVTSFLWIEKSKDSDLYNYADCEYYELTSILLKKFTANSECEWLKQYPMEYNVAIEIWETALLINATEVLVDNQLYSIPQ